MVPKTLPPRLQPNPATQPATAAAASSSSSSSAVQQKLTSVTKQVSQPAQVPASSSIKRMPIKTALDSLEPAHFNSNQSQLVDYSTTRTWVGKQLFKDIQKYSELSHLRIHELVTKVQLHYTGDFSIAYQKALLEYACEFIDPSKFNLGLWACGKAIHSILQESELEEFVQVAEGLPQIAEGLSHLAKAREQVSGSKHEAYQLQEAKLSFETALKIDKNPFAPFAYYALAKWVNKGLDLETRESYYEKAALGGITNAQYILGYYYIKKPDDANTPQNDKIGVEWLNKAVAGGHPNAQCLLGVMYVNERTGEELSPEVRLNRGVYYLTQANRQGDATAKSNLEELEKIMRSNDVTAASILTSAASSVFNRIVKEMI